MHWRDQNAIFRSKFNLNKIKQDVQKNSFARAFGPDITCAILSQISRDIHPVLSSDELIMEQLKWANQLKIMKNISNQKTNISSTSYGNSLEIYNGGDIAVLNMIQSIRKAKRRVWLETYIFDNDQVGELFLRELGKAALRQVDVCVLIDYCGGISLKQEQIDKLRETGADVVIFNSPWENAIAPFPFRDHRKILICDDEGYTGSMNITGETVENIDSILTTLGDKDSEDIIESHGDHHAKFFDLHVKITGPAVYDLSKVFVNSLYVSRSGVFRDYHQYPPTEPTGSSYVQVLSSNVLFGQRHIQRAIQCSIRLSSVEVNVASSYFLPPSYLRRELRRKHFINKFNKNFEGEENTISLKPKKTTRILVSGDSDFWPFPFDLIGQTHALRKFVQDPDTEVLFYDKQHMHAKFLTVDNIWTIFGSFNFDRFSSRRNLEVCVGVFDRSVAYQFNQIFLEKGVLKGWRSMPSDWFYHNPFARILSAFVYMGGKITGMNTFDGFDRTITKFGPW